MSTVKRKRRLLRTNKGKRKLCISIARMINESSSASKSSKTCSMSIVFSMPMALANIDIVELQYLDVFDYVVTLSGTPQSHLTFASKCTKWGQELDHGILIEE